METTYASGPVLRSVSMSDVGSGLARLDRRTASCPRVHEKGSQLADAVEGWGDILNSDIIFLDLLTGRSSAATSAVAEHRETIGGRGAAGGELEDPFAAAMQT